MDVDRLKPADPTTTQRTPEQPAQTSNDGKFNAALEKHRPKATTSDKPRSDNLPARNGPMLSGDKKPIDPGFFSRKPVPVQGRKERTERQPQTPLPEQGNVRDKPAPLDPHVRPVKADKKTDADSASTAGALALNQLPVQAHVAPQAVQKVDAPRMLPPQEVVNAIVKEVRFGKNELGMPEFQFDFQSGALEGLRLKISTEGDTVRATFLSQSEALGEIIKDNSTQLVEALHNKGLNLSELNVNVNSGNTGQQGDPRSFGQAMRNTADRTDGPGIGQGSAATVQSPASSGDSSRSATDYIV